MFMADFTDDGPIAASLRRHLLFAGAVCLLLIGGLGGWSATASISGAIIAPGTVTVKGHSKKIQHRDGGIIRSIHVREGDQVSSGDMLLALDGTDSGANLAVVDAQLYETMAREARLKAEQAGRDELVFSAVLNARAKHDERRAAVLAGQRALFVSRRAARVGRRARIAEQIDQFARQIEGLEAQSLAKRDEIILVDGELASLSGLLGQGLVTKTRMTSLQRERARLDGAYGGLVAEIARIGGAIAEKRLEIAQIDESFEEEVLGELQEIRTQIDRLSEQRVTLLDRFERVSVRAPLAGTVHQLAVHTEGGVIAPGETVMLIVPRGDTLVVSAQVRATDIDQLYTGQRAHVRLIALDQRFTPELEGRLTTISADLSVIGTGDGAGAGGGAMAGHGAGGESFYSVQVEIDEAELSKLDGATLLPGMPVEVFLNTTARTVLSYVTQPVADQIAHAFRE